MYWLICEYHSVFMTLTENLNEINTDSIDSYFVIVSWNINNIVLQI